MTIDKRKHANRLDKTGEAIMWVGLFLLGTMAIIGTIAIDIVLLTALGQQNSSEHNFFTGLLWGMLFSRSLSSENYWIALAISPVTSAVAIGLSFYFAVPIAGIAIAAGWATACLVFFVGKGLLRWSEHLYDAADKEEQDHHEATSALNHKSDDHGQQADLPLNSDAPPYTPSIDTETPRRHPSIPAGYPAPPAYPNIVQC